MNVFDKFVQKFNLDENTIKWLGLNTNITADSNAWQDHFTPDSVCDQMVELYKPDFNNQQQILVMFNVELIKSIYLNYEDVMLKNIYFIADTQKKFEYVKDRFPKINMCLLEKHDINKLNECIKGFNVKKFDVIFSNPPYGDSSDTALDLKICEEIFKFSDEMLIVQPGGWIDADSNTGKSKTWSEKLGKYIKSVYFLDLNSIMDIKLKTHGAIVYYTKNHIDNILVKNFIKNEEYIAESIHNITKYGKMWLNGVKQLKDYIETKYSDFMPAHAATSATSDFSIRFSRWCGNVGKADFYSPINITGVEKQFVEKSYVVEFTGAKMNEPAYIIFSLNSKNERENFVNYWKCKVTRFILSFYKHNINFTHGRTFRSIPWMDFTQEWNDKKLCEEFGISEELWKYIDNFIPDYYNDYYSGFGVKNVIPAHRDVKPSKEMYNFVGEEIINKLMSCPLGNKCGNRNIKFKKDGKRYDMNRYDNGDGTFTWSVYRVG